MFRVRTAQDKEKLFQIGPEILAHDKMKTGVVLREIIQIKRMKKTTTSKTSPPECDKYWFLTPETCLNPDNLPTS